MKKFKSAFIVILICILACLGSLHTQAAESDTAAKVTSPPASLNCDPFYQKHVDCNGIPILTSENVADAALIKVNEIIGRMLADRSDVRKALVDRGVRFIIIGANELTTQMPEYSDMKPKEFWDKRARGFGGKVSSAGEENIICLPVDRYDDESILIHEFAHTIHSVGLRKVDPNFQSDLRTLFQEAKARGLWDKVYAGNNPSEYWAEAVQSYYDCNREKNWNHNHINTREELVAYDPNLAEFVAKTLAHTKETDWRYKPLVQRPKVSSPPEFLKCNPFYKKYVYCRDLPFLGSVKVSDEAMLEANNIIRNMFRYRHDILAPMIEDGIRFVVIAASEKITDIPEYKDLEKENLCQKDTRSLSCEPNQLVISCGEENLLNYPIDPHDGESMLIREFAKAVHTMVGKRPVDKDFDQKRRKQQYELYVKRIDLNFDKKLRQLYKDAIDKGLWENTIAAKSIEDYWAEGVQSWFDANRESQKPDGLHNHVNTREELESYDPDLAEFIAEVFQHSKRDDWRYKPYDRNPKVTAPPESLNLHPFHKRYVQAGGLVITASANVADDALVEAHYIITNVLANRPDILKTMAKNGARFVIIGNEEQTCDVPEYDDLKPKEYWNRRTRGVGGRITSCGEENLLNYPRDRYNGENILIHELAHGISDMGLRRMDPNFRSNLKAIYDTAIEKGLWERTYAAENPAEYWAEGVQDYFDCNRQSRNGRRPDGVHNHVNTREELIEKDPDLAKFIAEIFRCEGKNAWRYVPYKTRNAVKN